MTSEIRKFTKILLIALLVLTPVRATWAFQDDTTDHTGHSNITMAIDSAGAAEIENCCTQGNCMSFDCEPCGSANPIVPMSMYVAETQQSKTNNSSLDSDFYNLTLTPLLHPPQV